MAKLHLAPFGAEPIVLPQVQLYFLRINLAMIPVSQQDVRGTCLQFSVGDLLFLLRVEVLGDDRSAKRLPANCQWLGGATLDDSSSPRGKRWCLGLLTWSQRTFRRHTQHHLPHCVFCAQCACEALEGMQVDNSMPQKFFSSLWAGFRPTSTTSTSYQ